MMLSARFLSTPSPGRPPCCSAPSCPSWCPSRSTGRSTICWTTGRRRRPGRSSRCPFAGRELIGVVWDEAAGADACREPPAEAAGRGARRAADAGGAPGAGHAMSPSETLAPRGSVLKLALSVPAALEPWPSKLAYRRADGEPPARLEPSACRGAGGAAGRHQPAGPGPGQGGRRRHRRGAGHGARRAAGSRAADRPADLAAARSRPHGRRADAGRSAAAASELCELVARRGGRGAARRRAGRRQDRGLFRGRGRGLARRPARARASARDRALGPVAGPVRAPVRHAAGGLALGADRGAAAANLAADRRGGDRRRGRRPLGPVPAADRPRPDRRRRGARRQLQAGGDASTTTPATWRWPAPGSRAAPWCWPRPRRRWRSAVAAGCVARRAAGASRAGATWRCRRAMAVPPCPRSGWSTCAATGRRAAASCRRRCARRCSATSRTAPSRSCSSTAAATPRSPCAAPAATGSPAPTARPGWSRTACAAGCSATIAATPCPRPSTARAAAPWAC